MKYLSFFMLLLFAGLSQAQSSKISGVVFVDENGNGIREAGEKPLKDVLLSNGSQLVETNRKGRYTIKLEAANNLFPILPAGYTFLPETQWWFSLPDTLAKQPKKIREVNFALVPEPSKGEFKTLVIGDIQVGDQEELSYADRSILPELRQRKDYDFSIFLGDLVNDESSLFAPLEERFLALDKPSWMVYGNHDKNSQRSHETQHLDFSKAFGPTRYAFHKEEVLFIMLNSIEPVGKYGYTGKYAAADLHFLESLLKTVPPDKLLVISQHIPLGMMDNKDELLELLENQEKVLLLSGHTHTVFQNFRERKGATAIHELTAGAVSGHWWTGEKDWQGIPLALMQDGTPRGYFELQFTQTSAGTRYQVHYKGVGLSPDKQLSLWFGEPGTEISTTLNGGERSLYANVFAGSHKTRVQLRIDGGEWQPMERNRMLDPFIGRIKKLQKEKLYPNAVSKRSPYLSRGSSHIWKADLPAGLEKGMHKLEIRAQDDYGLDHQETTWFRVEE